MAFKTATIEHLDYLEVLEPTLAFDGYQRFGNANTLGTVSGKFQVLSILAWHSYFPPPHSLPQERLTMPIMPPSF